MMQEKRQAKCPHLEKGFLKLGRPGFLVLAKNDCIMYLYHITNNVHQRKGGKESFSIQDVKRNLAKSLVSSNKIFLERPVKYHTYYLT